MATEAQFTCTSKGLPINPYNKALPPQGSQLYKRIKIATGGDSKTAIATSLCLRRTVTGFYEASLRMIQECDALAALLICLVTPIIKTAGANLPHWRNVESEYNDLSLSLSGDDCELNGAELEEALCGMKLRQLMVKAIFQVVHWIQPPGKDMKDDPDAGTIPQFSHYYYNMTSWQIFVVYKLFSLIKTDMIRNANAQWLDFKHPKQRARATARFSFCDLARSALASYAKSMFSDAYSTSKSLTAFRKGYIPAPHCLRTHCSSSVKLHDQ